MCASGSLSKVLEGTTLSADLLVHTVCHYVSLLDAVDLSQALTLSTKQRTQGGTLC